MLRHWTAICSALCHEKGVRRALCVWRWSWRKTWWTQVSNQLDFKKNDIIANHKIRIRSWHLLEHTSSPNRWPDLGVPGPGLPPEQLECAGVFGLDPPGRHHQISVWLGHHHQVGPLDDAPLDALMEMKRGDLQMAVLLLLDVGDVMWMSTINCWTYQMHTKEQYNYLSFNYVDFSFFLIRTLICDWTDESGADPDEHTPTHHLTAPHYSSRQNLPLTYLQFIAPCWWNQQYKHVDHVCDCKFRLTHTCGRTHRNSITALTVKTENPKSNWS